MTGGWTPTSPCGWGLSMPLIERRQIIVVDTETTGLGGAAVILEIAAVNLDTGEELRIVPPVTRAQLAEASPEAMQINRYYERGVFKDILAPEHSYNQHMVLRRWLKDNTLAGSNPAFDAKMLAKHTFSDPDPQMMAWRFGSGWHHRLLDLSNYAAGVLGLALDELPGLHKVCEILGVPNPEAHTALGDAQATAECFRRLMDISQARIPL